MNLRQRLEALSDAQRRAVAAALPTPVGAVELVAFVEGSGLDSAQLRVALAAKLPPTMVPAELRILERLPRNRNGKVDRAALLRDSVAHRDSVAEAYVDDIERDLAALWTEVLGVASPGRHEDFRALGGHSLLALRLTSRIQKRFAVAFPVAAVFQYPTLAELAPRLREAIVPTGSDLSGALVPIARDGHLPPLFCIHCVNGRVNQYYALAEELQRLAKGEQPVYGLQPPSMDGSEDIPIDLPTIAARHIEEIRSVQPHGPYTVSGHSFGGLVAFEIAQQLVAAGEKVSRVVLFDTVLPRREALPEQRMRHLDQIRGLGPGAMVGYLWRSLHGNLNTWRRDRARAQEEFKVQKHIARHRKRGESLPVELRDRFVRGPFRRAMMNYRAKPFPGRLLIFRTDADEWLRKEYVLLGWDGMAEEGIEVVDVEGNHGQVLGDLVEGTAVELLHHLQED